MNNWLLDVIHDDSFSQLMFVWATPDAELHAALARTGRAKSKSGKDVVILGVTPRCLL